MTARLVDPDWLTLAWYGQPLRRLCAGDGLRPLAATDDELASHLRGVTSGHVVAASPELTHPAPSPGEAIVVGGPCIGDCTRWPTIEALYDTAQTLLVARALEAPAVLYLGDEEEALPRSGEGKKWRKLAERFADWIPLVAEALGCDRVRTVRTSSLEHGAALESAGRPARALPGERLDRAFNLGGGEVRAQVESAREVTARVVEAHLPRVVAGHAGFDQADPPPVVMAENLQQANVFRLARELAAEAGHRLLFVAHLPAPSMTARTRMYRADSWEKVPAAELETIIAGDIPGLHPYARQFYGCWLDEATRANLVTAARRW